MRASSISAWKWLLPSVQVAAGIVLGTIGGRQTQHEIARNGMLWDAMSIPEIVLHAVNFPAAVGVGLLTGHRNLYIGVEYSLTQFLVYLVLIGVLWARVGWLLDGRKQKCQNKRKACIIPPVLESLFGLILLLSAVGVSRGPYAPLLVISAYAWAFVWILASVALTAKQILARRTTDNGTARP